VATAKRAYSRMSSPAVAAPYTRAVVNAMRKLYPESLAESWDNTGLLLEAPFDPLRRQMNSVLLTIDLTRAVADEAIERNDSIIVSYHPIIFRGLKSLTLKDPQQQTLLRLAAEGISVYSPHSAIDAAPGGLNDWLADIVTGTPAPAEEAIGQIAPTDPSTNPPSKSSSLPPPTADNNSNESYFPSIAPSSPSKRPTYMLQHHPSHLTNPQDQQDKAFKLTSTPHTRRPILPFPASPTDTGSGRLVQLTQPVPLPEIIDRIAIGLGNPKGFPVAVPQGREVQDVMVRRIAIWAGSGGGGFRDLLEQEEEGVDLVFTGEMSHHEALAAIERGCCVVCLFHSNSERGFLAEVLKGKLEERVKEEWDRLRIEERRSLQQSASDELLEALNDDHVEVHVSEVDRDPYGIMVSKADI